MTVKTKDGPRNAYIDPESGLRFYTYQGRNLPSVTSVRQMAGVPHGLMNWMISQMLDRACGRILKDEAGKEVGWEPGQTDVLVAMLERERKPRERVVEKNRIREARKWLREATTEERDRAAQKGTDIHRAAEHNVLPEDVPEEIRAKLRQYYSWLEDSGATILLKERQVFNLTLGYAGSFDLICRFPNGQVWIVDLKTGKGTYSDHVLQQVAYMMAEFVGDRGVVDEEATRLLHAVDGVAILHLRDDGWTFIQPTAGEAEWEAYRGLLAFAGWTHAHPDAESFTAASREGADRYAEHAAEERRRMVALHLQAHADQQADDECEVCAFLTGMVPA